MNDKEYAKQKARIKALAEKYIKPLGFGWFKIDIQDEELEHIFLHELTHVLIAPLRASVDNFEYTTEMVTKMLEWAIQAKL